MTNDTINVVNSCLGFRAKIAFLLVSYIKPMVFVQTFLLVNNISYIKPIIFHWFIELTTLALYIYIYIFFWGNYASANQILRTSKC